ncbi:bifunctional acetate--CoA ligase family protein/GNAT family N-acetyltransferase [Timonella senegalensis]|uniref:bifunctional acetate--CoA ligase family protein/GNAT family N-acetyltransferase n=1 Tax=Timonella senegalensis TaxID=1465825 RepID=UPI0028A7F1F8|nr:GNAT family N-acetyltransferase [Timonella senegalensis]
MNQTESGDSPEVAAYPSHWEADVVLRDGTPTHVRPIRPSDKDLLQTFHMGQSERSTYMRFFAAMARLSDRDLSRFTETDNVDRVAIVATLIQPDGTEAIIGVARFDRIEGDEAEVAFNISDHLQGRGLGSVLLEHISAAAREMGIRKFSAEVLPQNGRMLSVFREAGYAQSQFVDDGVVTVTVDLDPTSQSLQVMAEREYRAESKSMERLYSPNRVLLIGSLTDQPNPEEMRLAQAALASGIGVRGEEKLHVVGLSPVAIRDAQGRHGKPDNFIHHERLHDLAQAGETFDLAVLAVADTAVAPVLRELRALGVHAAVILAGGFAEKGEAGLALQREVIRIAHSAGIRIIGPSSYGLFSNSAAAPFNASLVPNIPRHGSTGLFCQSSAIAVTLMATVLRRNLGVSTFLAAGNRADISGNDLMQFWQEDHSSKAVGMYLESIGNPRKFARIARRLSQKKPVVVVTAGQSGYAVPRGHAVSPTNAPRQALDQMFRQSGVLRAQNTHELVDTLQFFETQPLPAGPRVGIIASSEALAAIAAEASFAAGLTVTEHVHVIRSMDLESEARGVLKQIYSPDACDVVLIAHVPTIGDFPADVAQVIAREAHRTSKPTLVSVYGLHGVTPEFTWAQDGKEVSVPAYSTPEDAVRTLKNVVDYANWSRSEQSERVHFEDIDKRRVEEILHEVEPGSVPARTAERMLAAYGINVWGSTLVASIDEAIESAELLGYPVVLKSSAEALRHRADLGGVRLNIANAAELRADWIEMNREVAKHLGNTPDGGSADHAVATFEVQKMAPTGVAVVVRSQEDPLYGPVISFGLSGDAVDLLGDISYRVPPVTLNDVSEMVRSIKAAPKLFGYKGLPPVDTEALENLIARVSLFSDDHPQIQSLELYPVIVGPEGCAAISAKIVVAPAQRKDGMRRALPL